MKSTEGIYRFSYIEVMFLDTMLHWFHLVINAAHVQFYMSNGNIDI